MCLKEGKLKRQPLNSLYFAVASSRRWAQGLREDILQVLWFSHERQWQLCPVVLRL